MNSNLSRDPAVQKCPDIHSGKRLKHFSNLSNVFVSTDPSSVGEAVGLGELSSLQQTWTEVEVNEEAL